MARTVARRATKSPEPLHLTPLAALKVGATFEWQGVRTEIAKINNSTPVPGRIEIIDPQGNTRAMGGAERVGVVSLGD
jgi:hypothetical protein